MQRKKIQLLIIWVALYLMIVDVCVCVCDDHRSIADVDTNCLEHVIKPYNVSQPIMF